MNGEADGLATKLKTLERAQSEQFRIEQDQSGPDRGAHFGSPEVEDMSRLDPNVCLGGSFLFEEQKEGQCVWGYGSEILWAGGEMLIIAGADGTGKSTIAQQIAMARMGFAKEVLGYAVAPDDGVVLYIAADRPSQIRRSFRRMVTADQRDRLDQQLVFYKGLPVGQLGDDPMWLARLVERYGATTLIIDSLKDLVSELTKEESVLKASTAIKQAMLLGAEVVILHHDRKASQMGRSKFSISDVYGSRFLTAGMGSVIGLQPLGKNLVRLIHLKQPNTEVGPFDISHDQVTGRSSVFDKLDVLDVLGRLGGRATARDVAAAMWLVENPSRSFVMRATRELNKRTKGPDAALSVLEGNRGGRGGSKPAVYVLNQTRDPEHLSLHDQRSDSGSG